MLFRGRRRGISPLPQIRSKKFDAKIRTEFESLHGKTVTEDRLEALRIQQEEEFETKVMNKILPKILETGEPVMGHYTNVLGEPVETDSKGNVLHLDILIEGGHQVGKFIEEFGEDSREAQRALQEWSNAYRFLQKTGQMA